MRYVLPSLMLGTALALATVASARAQSSIDECEKIQAADAYNQCLAKFGPSGKNLNMEPEKPGDIKNNSAEAAATGGRPGLVRRVGRHHGGARRGGGGGRKRASFSVGHGKT